MCDDAACEPFGVLECSEELREHLEFWFNAATSWSEYVFVVVVSLFLGQKGNFKEHMLRWINRL